MSKRFGGVKTIAGLSFIGFCAASVIADRVDLNPIASQVAGFAGAFLGALVARGQSRQKSTDPQAQSVSDTAHGSDLTSVEARED